ncbi:MAG: adenylate/guanylate cyclase domain-containing protein, partial [Chloroflexi bacterium]|nr:adenylate/guanylate cyclase domain-containing protein [Chloroflexota bacterium]
MDPAISFCRTPDGGQLAYTTLGDGPVLIVTPASLDTIESRFKVCDEHFWTGLASHFTVVSYDRRGTGLSDRDRSDFTPAFETHDILALADALGANQFDLMSGFQLTPAAIGLAIDQPQRLQRLVLYAAFARGESLAPEETRLSLTQMARGSIGLAFRLLADLTVPHEPRETLDALVQIGRHSLHAETMARFLESMYDADITDLLPRVTTPTLVLHRQGDLCVNWQHGREVSAAIPGTRFSALRGDVHWPWMGDVDQVLDALFDFLAPGIPVPAREQTSPTTTAPKASHQLRTILFTDVEASTQLTDHFGDEQARDILRRHEQLTRRALAAHGGTEIKTMGDGFMAAFSSVSEALDAAISMQRSISAAFDGSDTP